MICRDFAVLPNGNSPCCQRVPKPAGRGLGLELGPDAAGRARIGEEDGAKRDNGCSRGDELERVHP